MTNTIKDYYKKAEDELVTLLSDNIKDPLGKHRPAGRFVDHGREHYEGKTPRILVKRKAGSSSPYTGAGERKQDVNSNFAILIEVAPSQPGNIDGVKMTGSELLNVLSGQVAKVMEDNVVPYENNSSSVIKQIMRISEGDYNWNPVTRVHYTIQLYNVYVVNN